MIFNSSANKLMSKKVFDILKDHLNKKVFEKIRNYYEQTVRKKLESIQQIQ